MTKVSVFATIEVAPGALETVKTRVLEHRERCLATEPGTLLFELMVPREEPNRLHVYEVYEDQAAFDVHWNGASIERLRQETGETMKIVSGIWGTPFP